MKLKDRELLWQMLDKCRVNTVRYREDVDCYFVTYLNDKDKEVAMKKAGDKIWAIPITGIEIKK